AGCAGGGAGSGTGGVGGTGVRTCCRIVESPGELSLALRRASGVSPGLGRIGGDTGGGGDGGGGGGGAGTTTGSSGRSGSEPAGDAPTAGAPGPALARAG